MSIKNFLKPYEYELLKSVLKREGKDIESEAVRIIQEFYTQTVSREERETAEEKFRDEYEYNLRLQDVGRFSVIHLYDEEDEYYFTTESHMDFYHAAYAYSKYVRGDECNYTLDSIAKEFAERSNIDPYVFNLLRKETDSNIIAVMKFDFEEMTLTLQDNDKQQSKKYKLDDIADAVGVSEKEDGASVYRRKLIVEEILKGKELELTRVENDNVQFLG